jgi:DNA-3-methyladenine glycosylase II
MSKDFSSEIDKAIEQLSANDPVLAVLIARYPRCKIEPHTNYYQELVDAIISQQLSVKAAQTIEKRFCDLFDSSSSFPSPDQIVLKSIDELRSAGLSRAKAIYVQDLARHMLDGSLRFDDFNELSNQEIINKLVAVKGIGEWTAHMFLMFSIGRLDILPTGDLGIRNGMRLLYGLDHLPAASEMQQIAANNHWDPHQSVASWYIWQSLDNKPFA